MISETLGIIGGTGWLGGAIAKALMAKSLLPAGNLIISNRTGRHPLAQQGVCLVTDNQALVTRSDMVIIAVRPEHFASLDIDATGKTVVSLMAGVTAQTIAAQTSASAVVRAMPNAAVEIGQSFTPWFCWGEVNAAARELVQRLFESVGTAAEVQEEGFIDYLSALSGTGPAFPALLMTALANQAKAAGIPSDIAQLAAKNVVVNGSQLLENHDAQEMIEALVAYRGVTAAALQSMIDSRFEAHIGRALEAGAAVARKGLHA
ncbi:pyrroline-5-carboxylate reductase dimerization domain-containing protein [Pseudomonas corrugata]|jgi:pyrroline-5-carboxylate reductase|uniref:Pyrroline-5-carboxylate reductase n=1 Tax=Pseudomonas corrugata TaxID=47879 RepID=A0A8B6UX28_9PSED|nr:pyrroline-5-carboxylate reductase dimerization domain-containing protein [Pseudomonas corrugata]AOE65097.1 pyrroline-5-carboxylate reductase [Pseudomonas corrugata]MDU9025732.1 pyrroline-5-carboxylate reductase dimerization domain-containing protein [Pseudomonas corrugata]MDU9035641.1 pyrroline-5-carboxylate reductase dimerization domain-containing protein [Pseudomonas corrugata]MDU9040458.1 pyrroline-5-carboxylate reductase dimerization domain-containing protein [Pseudomonas corrugata]QTH1